MSLLVKFPHSCQYDKQCPPVKCTAAGVLMGAEMWKLVSLGGVISHVNFSFLLRTAESEQFQGYCVVGWSVLLMGWTPRGCHLPSCSNSLMNLGVSPWLSDTAGGLGALGDQPLCACPRAIPLFNYNCIRISQGTLWHLHIDSLVTPNCLKFQLKRVNFLIFKAERVQTLII